MNRPRRPLPASTIRSSDDRVVAVAAAEAPAAAAAAAAARATAAAAAGRTVLRLVDAQSTTFHRVAVQRANGRCGISARHLDEAKAARAAGLAIRRKGDRLDDAEGAEQRADRVLGGSEREVTNVNLSHDDEVSR